MDIHDEIEKVAYGLWEESGRIEGRDKENWLEAEMIVMEKHKDTVETDESVQEETSNV